MKKSNALLLGGFLALTLLVSAIHLTLYAKYKSGNYTVYDEDDLALQSVQSFPNVLIVSVRDVQGATVVFSDAARLEKEQEGIQYVQKGDTLQISGSRTNQEEHRTHATFHVPHNAVLSASNSSLVFKNDDKVAGNNIALNLERTSALFSGVKSGLRLGNAKIVASDSSAVLFEGKTKVGNLDVQLSKSTFEYGEGDIGQLSIAADSLSRLSLQSKHLSKANIKTVPVK